MQCGGKASIGGGGGMLRVGRDGKHQYLTRVGEVSQLLCLFCLIFLHDVTGYVYTARN
jgi:hypothetical protein